MVKSADRIRLTGEVVDWEREDDNFWRESEHQNFGYMEDLEIKPEEAGRYRDLIRGGNKGGRRLKPTPPFWEL
jgi:hypothetical protein